ncbi:MAG: MlaD family protein [Candidatus Ratteibacteria bacterium]|nr:MlaD family protein [Candidatus Ratteibacteria bacterium]
MKRDKLSLELRVGIFVIITFILAIVFIISQVTTGKYRGYEIGIRFDYVGGLESGSPVRVSGVRVGEVKQIEILYEVKPEVLVRVKLKQDIKISAGSRITIQTLGFIGEKYIEIIPSPSQRYIQPGEIVDGESPVTMEKLVEAGQDMIIGLNSILSDISKITGDKEFQKNIKTVVGEAATAITKIETTFTEIENLTQTIAETSKKVDNLISVNGPKFEELLGNTNELVSSGRIKMEETMDEIKRFASAGTEAAESFQDIRSVAASFDKTATDIQKFLYKIQNEGLLARLMKEEELVDQIKYELLLLHNATTQFNDAASRIIEVSTGLNRIITDVESGKGTVGKFLKEEEIYNNINTFVEDIRKNPWKLLRKR